VKEKRKERDRKREEKKKKIEKINYLFFRNCYSQFILTIILLDNKNKR
jgi:hypothetical protein